MAKVTVVGKFYPPFRGGIEANTADVCEYLANTHEVTALVYNHERGPTTVETLNGVTVYRCRSIGIYKSQPLSISLPWQILRSESDVVLFHAPNFVANAALLLKLYTARCPLPVVITHHMDVFGRALIRACVIGMYERLALAARFVIVTSLKNAAISKDIPKGANIVSVPLGIDLKEYAVDESFRAEARRWRTALAGDAPLVGFVGRHARYKGLDVLIKALAKLENVHAAIAGDGPYRAPTEKLAADLGISHRIHFLGSISQTEKLRLLSAIDVFAFPSTEITEAFGISQVEAMAMGAPVVASNLPTGVTDIAQNGVTALVVEPGNVDELANALSRLIEDRPLATRLADGALSFVKQDLTREAVVTKTAAVIEGALASQSAS